jgi:hypothetical protein
MNPMKVRNLAIAGAVAAALGSAANATNVTPDYVIYTGGGSAEPIPVQVALCTLLQNVDVFTDASTDGQSADYLVLEGTAINAIGGIAAGKSVMVMYKFNGGSYLNGAQYLSNSGGTLTYPTVAGVLNNAAIPSGTFPQTGPAGSGCTAGDGFPTFAYNNTQSGNSILTNLEQPALGVTDLEVAAFSGDNNPNGPSAPLVTVGHAAKGYDLVEGIAVSAPLFAVKSNFTANEVEQILSGGLTDWHDFIADSGAPVAAAGTPIKLIDRNIGSGTKTAGSAFFLGYPWLGSFSTRAGSAVYGYTAGPVTAAGYQDISASNSATVVTDLQTCTSSSLYCIAVLSADNAPYLNQVGGKNTYDFVSINGTYVDTNVNGVDSLNDPAGAGSSFKNVILGNYGFYYQVSLNQDSTYLASNPIPQAFSNALQTALQSSQIAGLATGKQFPVSAPAIVLDPDVATFVTGKAGVAIESRQGNSDSFPAMNNHAFGVTITFGKDPL